MAKIKIQQVFQISVTHIPAAEEMDPLVSAYLTNQVLSFLCILS